VLRGSVVWASVGGKLEQFLETPLVREFWRAANRTAHRQLMQISLHESPRPVVLDLGTIAASLSRQNGVIGQLSSALPPNTARLVVLEQERPSASGIA